LLPRKEIILKDYIKIARFDHWIKQLFILPGAWFALIMANGSPNLLALVLGLLSTCAAASANYCINEWLDAEFDKFHPVKKHRPFIVHKLSVPVVLTEYGVFVVISFALAYLTGMGEAVLLAIALLLVMGMLYNVRPVRTKDMPYIDVLSESLNNAIRLVIGWFCVTNAYFPPVSIVFGYWMGGAFLMAAKRFAEYRMIGDPRQAKLYRKSFARYSEITLLLSAVFYGFLAVFFCGVFLVKYKIELLIMIPFLCGLFCYYLSLCYKPDSAAQKPEKLFQEKFLMLFVAMIIVLFAVLYYVRIPQLDIFLRLDLQEIPK
jgi:4-hydroxybenzoate polyprenyltransferase